MVLKRCIYGVDKNPLTVELAKVSLWLHSFTVGAPLSFLDHHLRCGDSLLGLRVLEAHKDFERLGGLSASNAIQGAENATDGMHLIERLSDADVAEVRQSAGLFKDVEQATANLRGVLDFLGGLRWETAGLKKRALANVEGAVVEALGRESSIAFDLLARGPGAAGGSIERDSGWVEFADCWTQSRSIADRERLSALGGRLPRRLAPLAKLPARRRLRRRDRQSALGPHQAARGGVVRHPRPRHRPRANRRGTQSRHQTPPRPGKRLFSLSLDLCSLPLEGGGLGWGCSGRPRSW